MAQKDTMAESVEHVLDAVRVLLHQQITSGLWTVFKTEKHVLLERSTEQPVSLITAEKTVPVGYPNFNLPLLNNQAQPYLNVSRLNYPNPLGIKTRGTFSASTNQINPFPVSISSEATSFKGFTKQSFVKPLIRTCYNQVKMISSSARSLPSINNVSKTNTDSNKSSIQRFSNELKNISKTRKRQSSSSCSSDSAKKRTTVQSTEFVVPKQEESLDFVDFEILSDDETEEEHNPNARNKDESVIDKNDIHEQSNSSKKVSPPENRSQSPMYRHARYLQYRCHLCSEICNGDQIVTHYLNIHQKVIDGKTCRICGVATKKEYQHMMRRHKFHVVSRSKLPTNQNIKKYKNSSKKATAETHVTESTQKADNLQLTTLSDNHDQATMQHIDLSTVTDNDELTTLLDYHEQSTLPENHNYANMSDEQSTMLDNQDQTTVPDNQEQTMVPDNQDQTTVPDNQDQTSVPDNQDQTTIPNNQDLKKPPDNYPTIPDNLDQTKLPDDHNTTCLHQKYRNIKDLTTQHESKTFVRHKCHICLKTFSYPKLINHLRETHNSTVVRGTCRICNEPIADSQRNKHYSEVHDFVPFVKTPLRMAEPLPAVDPNAQNIKILRQKQFDVILFVCHYCGLFLDSEASLQMHIYDNHCPEKFIHFCRNCDAFYPSRKHFSDHLIAKN